MSNISVSGNLDSLRNSIIDEIEELYSIENTTDFVPKELAEKMADLTGRINREIAVYINRKGNIIDVSVGDSTTVSLPAVEGRRSKMRLSGIRCIHTHPNGDGRLSAVDLNSMTKLKLDAMIAIGVNEGEVSGIFAALPLDLKQSATDNEIYGPYSINDSKINSLFDVLLQRDKELKELFFESDNEPERAILVAVETSKGEIIDGKTEGERSLEELSELTKTAGGIVLEKMLQKRQARDSAFLIGRGKAEELSLIRQALNVDTIIFDDDLTGSQVRNLESITGAKVIDRTTLILDIFAQRAKSRDGKLQVELAQLKYMLPRLIGLGRQMSRLGAGIGTRGPGEKQLEVDRRHIRRRINFLEEELGKIQRQRAVMRQNRIKNKIPVFGLVGYTNAGKSTLLNQLCKSDVLAENKLFATLDPTIRKLELKDGNEALLVDTVGFIRKLPHDLINAFKSTLEEALLSDVLIHVIDISSSEAETHLHVINEILISLGATKKPSILVLNKIDLTDEPVRLPETAAYERVYEISAKDGYGVDKLLEGICEMCSINEIEVKLVAPYSEGWIISYIHENGKYIESEYVEEGVKIKTIMSRDKIGNIQKFIVE